MKIGMIGMGAIGSIYGADLNAAYKDDFFAIANGRYFEDLSENGVVVNGETHKINVVQSVDATEACDLIIMLVKNYSLDAAICDIAPFVSEKTVILPLLNGISAKGKVENAFPNAKVLHGLVIGIDATRLEKNVHHTRKGLVQFGEEWNVAPFSEAVELVKSVLSKTTIPFEICEDMQRTVWKKFMMNIACNQVSAACDCYIFECTTVGGFSELSKGAMTEVLALAKAKNVNLFPEDAEEIANFIANFVKTARTSMHQDMIAKRKTEVDSFGGTVIAESKKFELKTPTNEFLVNVIKGKEEQNGTI